MYLSPVFTVFTMLQITDLLYSTYGIIYEVIQKFSKFFDHTKICTNYNPIKSKIAQTFWLATNGLFINRG